jgi:drug/metabolite transporter (DMT)-like permease
VLTGIACTTAGWLVFSFHDACVKLLVADFAAPQVLFMRSLVILCVCLAVGRSRLLLRAWSSPVRWPLVMRGLVLVGAWLAYYTAARHLQLALLITIYFASPLLVTALAIPILGERVPWQRWVSLTLGFTGVLIACRPGDLSQIGPIGLALFAALMWACAMILIRKIARAEPSLVQMLLANTAFLVTCGTAMPWLWLTPDLPQLALMLLVGGLGAMGQFLIYEGIRRAPASVVAPLEFTALLWSFLLGYAIWRDIPGAPVFLGAGFILLSGLLIVLGEWRSKRHCTTV